MIIVNGATGFVGRYLVDHLVKNGEKVVAVGRSRKYDWFFNELGVPFVQMDVTRAEEFSKLPTQSVKAFVHLAALIPAAVQEITPEVFLNVNTLGTIRALEHCRKNNIGRFVYTTTLYEGMEHTELPITEEMGRKYALTGDHAAYVISKAAAADYVEHYSQEFGIRGIILRMTGLLGYGRLEGFWAEGVFYPSAFEIFYKRAKAGQALEVWGKHEARRDSLYVKDAVRAISKALSSDRAQGLYLIGSGAGITNEQEIRTFAEVFGSEDNPVPVVYRPDLPEKSKSYYFDIGKAKRDFGWEPAYSYRDILVDYDAEVQSGRFRSL
ncbi:MAG TPA: NAD(P)-dependent oxidoreductase [Syntrophobacteraceae bacterium]|nr:NAD(P)-dependent oxidoreductase [Syntrophobacteraceae bacterium]